MKKTILLAVMTVIMAAGPAMAKASGPPCLRSKCLLRDPGSRKSPQQILRITLPGAAGAGAAAGTPRWTTPA